MEKVYKSLHFEIEGKTIFNVVNDNGDVVFNGTNAMDLVTEIIVELIRWTKEETTNFVTEDNQDVT